MFKIKIVINFGCQVKWKDQSFGSRRTYSAMASASSCRELRAKRQAYSKPQST